MSREYYSNKEVLSGENWVYTYSEKKSGRVLDIGCGQSPYLLDLIGSDFELNGIDESEVQIELLESRALEISPEHGMNIQVGRYPNPQFEGQKFDAIVLSNVLHFYTWSGCKEFVKEIKSNLKVGSLLILTVHSAQSKMPLTENHFRHFFKQSEIEELFDKREFEYLFVQETSAAKRPKDVQFVKDWIRELCIQSGNSDEAYILHNQKNHLKGDNRTEQLTFVLKMKKTDNNE